MTGRGRRGSSGADQFAGALVALMIVVSLAVAVVQATHGLILLVPLALGVGLVRKRQRDVRLRREAAEREQRYRRWEAGQLERLYQQHPSEFELTTRDVLAGHGYRLSHAGRTRDRGVDLIGFAPDGAKVIVQCKRYGRGRTVGGPDVRALIGATAQADAHHALLVTTATFTSEATLAARGRVMLIDGPQLVALAQRPAAVPVNASRPAPPAATQPWWRRA